MPGLVGMATADRVTPALVNAAQSARELLRHGDTYRDASIWQASRVVGTGTVPAYCATAPEPAESGQIVLWLDGRLYSRGRGSATGESVSDALWLAREFESGTPSEILDGIEGEFAGVAYDRRSECIHLFTDRYGLRYLYWTSNGTALAWFSEAKAALAVPWLSLKLDETAVRDFLSIGQLLEDESWFEGVQLVPSATLLTWSLDGGPVSRARYWWWDRIPRTPAVSTQADAAASMGELLALSVTRCLPHQPSPVGVLLSGGLDSRVCVAALSETDCDLHTFTFGRQGSADMCIAQKVAALAGAQHHPYILSSENWFDPRMEGTWVADAHSSFIHLHGYEFAKDMAFWSLSAYDGLAGDTIRGSYLQRGRLDTAVTPTSAAAALGGVPLLYEGRLSPYEGLPKLEFFLIQNRLRRRANGGGRRHRCHVDALSPFLFIDLLNFVYSVPDTWRFRDRLYASALLHRFPRYFQTIPWQNTMLPVGASHWHARAKRLQHGVSGRLRAALGMGASHRQYTDYSAWMLAPRPRRQIEALLLSPQALYHEHLPAGRGVAAWEELLSGRGSVEVVGRYLTLEIWLQQLFNGRFRCASEEEPLP